MFKKILLATLILTALMFVSCSSTETVAEAKISAPVEIAPQEPEMKSVSDEAYDEYSRSTHDVNISMEEFNRDKKAILKIIEELSVVMSNKDYNKWLSYIEPESITFWSNPNNLKLASRRLPVKNMKLANLYDYFIFVFCPSRRGRTVDEIRYISLDSVKAVQNSGDVDVVYYNFVKVDGKWMVKIPLLSSQEQS